MYFCPVFVTQEGFKITKLFTFHLIHQLGQPSVLVHLIIQYHPLAHPEDEHKEAEHKG